MIALPILPLKAESFQASDKQPFGFLIAEWRQGTRLNAVLSCLLKGIRDCNQDRFRPWPSDKLQAARQALIAVSHGYHGSRPMQRRSNARSGAGSGHITVAVRPGWVGRGWNCQRIDAHFIHRCKVSGAHPGLIRLQSLDNGIFVRRRRGCGRQQADFMQGMEFARSRNVRQAFWKCWRDPSQVALDRRSNFAERMETGRELIKLRYHERINDLCPDTLQIGDSSVE